MDKLKTYVKALTVYNPNAFTAHKKLTAEQWNALWLTSLAQGNRQEDTLYNLTEHLIGAENLANNSVQQVNGGNFVYGRNNLGKESIIHYTSQTDANSLAYRNDSGTFEVKTPLKNKDVANKEYVDAVNNELLATKDIVNQNTADINGLEGTVNQNTTDIKTKASISALNDEATIRAGSDNTINARIDNTNGRIDALNLKVPEGASEQNKLATRDFVNSSIAQSNANRVTYDVSGSGFPSYYSLSNASTYYFGGKPYTPDSNDYAVVIKDEKNNDAQSRYEYGGGKWSLAYVINNRPYTAAETEALESGITKSLVDDIGNLKQSVDDLETEDTNIKGSIDTINTKIGTLETEDTNIKGSINSINTKIPNEANSSNKLADKAFVGKSITDSVQGKADKATTLAGYKISDAYNKKDTDAKISTLNDADAQLQAQITALQEEPSAKGVVLTYADLPSSSLYNNGDVIKVLSDENYGGRTTYYKLQNNAWEHFATLTDKGTDVSVGEVLQTTLQFTADPQTQINNVNSEIDTIKTELADVESTLVGWDTLVGRISDNEDEISRLGESMETADEDIDNLQSFQDTQTQKNIDLEGTIATNTRDIKSNTDSLSGLQTALDLTNRGLGAISEDVANLTQKDNTLQNKIDTVEAIAKGKSKAKVYADIASMTSALKGYSREELALGDNLLIKAVDVPDYWISGLLDTNAGVYGYYQISPLENQKIDLSEYYNKNEVDSRLEGVYKKPATGIPLTDLENTAQEKISGALQINEVPTPAMSTKLDLYARNNLGGVEGIETALAVYADTIPQRDSQGNLQGNTPINNSDYATKKYVDDNSGGGESGGLVVVTTLPNVGENDKLYKVNKKDLYMWTEKVATSGEASLPPDKVTLTMEVTEYGGEGAAFLKKVTDKWGIAYECILVIKDVGVAFVEVNVGDIIVPIIDVIMLSSIDETTGDFVGMSKADLHSSYVSVPSNIGEIYSVAGSYGGVIRDEITHYTITQDSKISVNLNA